MFRVALIFALIELAGIWLLATPLQADTWRGTAPFCSGQCLPGESEVRRDSRGDGGYCLTGSKALCRNSSRLCSATSAKAECYGAVMVCENGSNDPLSGAWNACSAYACGVCIGFGDNGISILSAGSAGGTAGWAPVPCASGYVWREAFAGDYVCVPPQTRTRTRQENAAAAQRAVPDSDRCVSGFVWREAVPADHVCVTPDIRTRTREDNRLAASRIQRVAFVTNDRCKPGYVWREAVRDDRVCVSPETRTLARNDNSRAAERKVPGSDRCKPGYVWREVIPSDHVCVSPATRAAAAADTAMAPRRVAGN